MSDLHNIAVVNNVCTSVKVNHIKTFCKDEVLLQRLEPVGKRKDDSGTKARSLILWFLRNQDWTAKQRYLAKKLVREHKKEKQEVQNRDYWIYVIGDTERVKIGYSYDPEKRKKGIQTGQDRNLKLLWKIRTGTCPKAAKKLEKRFHKKCRSAWIRGEWFKYEALEECKRFHAERELSRKSNLKNN